MLQSNSDTIVAISTPSGKAGIGIIKLSGSSALKIASFVFKPSKNTSQKSFSLRYGKIIKPDNGETIDEALMAVMRAPRSYTKEDVVEFHCHGGYAVLRQVLELCMKNGARLAEPGEFTKRAFLNGRIDLSQAEAVADIVSAQSESARKIAVQDLEGRLSKKNRRNPRRNHRSHG